MENVSGFVKRIRDIMRNDSGINGDAQRIEQIVWMLFLKVYDTKEKDWEIDEDNYVSIIPDDASAEFIVVPASSSLNKTDIQNQINGSYDYPIAQFRKNGITISDFQSLITPIDVVSDEFDYHTIDL